MQVPPPPPCYFWENAKPDFISTEREFPLYNRLVSGIVSDSDRRNVRSAEQGFYISVFPSFIGDILLDLTLPGMILWIIAFIAICYALIPSTADPDTVIHASDYLIVFMLGIIPSFGIFYYRFFDFQSTIIIFSLIIIAYLSKHTFSLSAADDDTPIAESADKKE